VRSLYEVAAWTDGLPAMSDQFPANARQAFLLTLKNNGVGNTVQVDNFVMQLPVSLNSFENKQLPVRAGKTFFLKLVHSLRLTKNL
jgi:hypothetical protein